jgi:hypothetical protein
MKTTTIVFRGLMVLHKHGDTMEIGFVDAGFNPSDQHEHNGHTANGGNHPHVAANHPNTANHEHPAHYGDVHIPRILTTKNGVLSEIFDLRNRPELGSVRNWTLEVTNPRDTAVSLRQQNSPNPAIPQSAFVRTATGSGEDFEKDFRWITDLEAADLHGRDLSLELNTRQFLFVLYVRNGSFYTRLLSPVLRRKRLNPMQVEAYGPSAAVVGCDITFEDDGGVSLMAGGPNGSTVFNFESDEGTVYEISNGPPDVPVEQATPLDAPGHFHMYYDKLFKNPVREFDLITEDQAPAPDPTLCGVTFLSLRRDPL